MTSDMAGFSTKAEDLDLSQTPLREFEGVLNDIRPHTERDTLLVDLNIRELAVKHSVIPYVFPVATLTFKYSKKDRSMWGLLLTSSSTLGFSDLADVVGKKIHMKATERSFVPTVGEDEEPPEAVKFLEWAILSIDDGSAAKVAPADHELAVLDLMHGKTETDFTTEAIRTDAGRHFQSELLESTLIPRLISENKIEKDGDTLWVVGRDR